MNDNLLLVRCFPAGERLCNKKEKKVENKEKVNPIKWVASLHRLWFYGYISICNIVEIKMPSENQFLILIKLNGNINSSGILQRNIPNYFLLSLIGF